MGILDRMKTILKANVNDAITKAEDPEKMLNQLIIDMQDQYTKAKSEVTVAIADEKRLERLYDEQVRLRDEWTRKAELAVGKGNDTLAVEALKRKNEYDQLAAQYKVQLDGQKQATAKLKESLRELNNKIEEAQRKKNLLIARSKRAKAQESIQKTMSSINDTSVFANFERMEKKVEDLEARAEAYSELSEEVEGDTLAKEFEKLERGNADDAVMNELQALKEKLNK